MFHFTLKDWIRQSLIAALYVVLVLLFLPISFGEIQFRVAELLLIVVFFDKKAVLGLTVGTFVANLYSPGPQLPFDLTLGVLATCLSVVSMVWIKNKYIALLMPTLFNGIIVGYILHIVWGLPLLLTMLYVAIGEFGVTYVVGLPVYKILNKHTGFKSLFEE
ncbi:QueT transporter family protein [Paracholeplasma manati]|uniref:QueT transporter family protein n=1 Tax=Paracholeplasma manati TaxID=591373 RepID=A0ABT2Y6M7_9MOLU|nr:QueT transporter family protein [Paracholeplasma manati]MCV2232127.1 QueT transporter family protein [Paracholeplasma manati]MDG0888084.1 QueT transporter family protein [Paracholeplasma manati]